MTVFADASALVKLYVAEAHHDVVRSIGDPIAISAWSRVEVPAALWRRGREAGEVAAAATVVAAFDVDCSSGRRFGVVNLRSPLLVDAARLAGVHGLRSGDAVQLASALATRRVVGSLAGFACFDRSLSDAARREGLKVID